MDSDLYSAFISMYEQTSDNASELSRILSFSSFALGSKSPCMFSSMYRLISSLIPGFLSMFRLYVSVKLLLNPPLKMSVFPVALLWPNARADFGLPPILTLRTLYWTPAARAVLSMFIEILAIILVSGMVNDFEALSFFALPLIGMPREYSSGYAM